MTTLNRAVLSSSLPLRRQYHVLMLNVAKTIKLMYNRQCSAKDRESVFWFNVLEVPPKPDAAKATNQSLLQLAFRTRIKLFYRPKGIEVEFHLMHHWLLKWSPQHLKAKQH